ncbi:phosphonate ABC transporter ATP-binding protein [Acidovorax kalamii]|uniref:phosphonate ABC transporter ATP-binding protein n=1 Tax=Acidovorax kalamii TaxID=2004485 RepID=UPI002090D313|nr:phosphonate ABC transporter ATP-binding protein [Acidovorax kalamii]MCO5356815.1 phosphonate ABC transporter ATP-binding protein [Acidovorax kalamii]
MTAALHIHQLNKHFANGKHALRDINLTVQRGEMVALIGASGSGKSTLLRHVAGLVVADAASDSLIEVDGRCVQQGGRIHSDIRKVRSQVGFVFQQFNLVDRLPVLMNVLVGLLHRTPWWRGWLRMFKPQERALALEALHRVGIAECHAQRASTLSGGQQQRAAIARTLVQGAKVVLADEPIASLDPESSRKVMDILARINREDRCTVIVSLHQVDVAIKYCPRVVALHHGQVVYDGPSAALTPALLRGLYGVQADEILSDASGAHPAPAHAPMPAPQWSPAIVQAA